MLYALRLVFNVQDFDGFCTFLSHGTARREMLIASEHVSLLIGLLPSHIAVATRFNVQDSTAG